MTIRCRIFGHKRDASTFDPNFTQHAGPNEYVSHGISTCERCGDSVYTTVSVPKDAVLDEGDG